jgi:hypothetical protein
MTATLGQVRAALKTRLQAISGLEVYARPPGTINPPAALIAPAPGSFLTYRTSHTSHDLELIVVVFVQWGEDDSATDALDAYLADAGASSVYATVQADPTLGGVVDSAAVLDAQNHGRHEYPEGVPYLGVEFNVGVLL